MINFKKGFTLAEILVTLTVIGVIASITIPSVITHRNEAETVAKVKKFTATMEEVYRLSRLENGPPPFWNVKIKEENGGMDKDTVDQIASYIVPFLNVARDYGSVNCSNKAETDDNCGGYTDRIKYLSGKNTENNHINNDAYYKVLLEDGTFIWFRGTPPTHGGYCQHIDGDDADPVKNICSSVFFDVNGPRKPNTIGKDIFYIHITAKGIEPDRHNDCIDDTKHAGRGCISYILRNDDMKYPKK